MTNGHEFFADQISTMGDVAMDKGLSDEAKFIWAMALLLHYKDKAPDAFRAVARAARMQLLMALKRDPELMADDLKGLDEGYEFDETGWDPV